MNLEELCGIPKNLINSSVGKIKNLSSDQLQELQEWAINAEGNCILQGKSGRGKTYTAVALMNFLAYAKKIMWDEQYFLEISSLNQRWLANFDDYSNNFQFAFNMKEKRVLVMDDLGVKKPSDAFLDYLYEIINCRTNNSRLITIFTSNLNGKELTESIGPRLVSRICGGNIFMFEGEDLRMEKHLKKKEEKIVNANFQSL